MKSRPLSAATNRAVEPRHGAGSTTSGWRMRRRCSAEKHIGTSNWTLCKLLWHLISTRGLKSHLTSCPMHKSPAALPPGPRAIIVLRPSVRAMLQQQLRDPAVYFACCIMQGSVASALCVQTETTASQQPATLQRGSTRHGPCASAP